MKGISVFSIVILGAMLFTLTTLATADDFKPGTYVISGEGNLSIKFEGNTMTVMKDDEVLVESKCKITGQELEVTDQSGPLSCGDDKTGKYKWRLEGKKLSFVVVEDACEERAQAITSQPWILKDDQK